MIIGTEFKGDIMVHEEAIISYLPVKGETIILLGKDGCHHEFVYDGTSEEHEWRMERGV